MVKYMRRIIFLVFIMAMCFAMAAPFAFAEMDTETFGHWMGVALKASAITAESTAPVVLPIVDFLADPFNITQDLIFQPINYAFPRVNLTTPSQDLESYLQRSHITVRGDTITIDGVDYQDIWVTNDAAQALRTNVLDLQTAFEIASNRSGSFVSGAGSVNGVPIFNVGGSFISQNIYFDASNQTAQLGNFGFVTTPNGTGVYIIRRRFNSASSYSNITGNRRIPTYFRFQASNSSHTSFRGAFSDDGSTWAYYGTDSITYPFESGDFEFVWVSKTIPAEQLEPDEGLHILVPNNPDQFSDTSVKTAIQTFLNSLNDFDVDIDISLADSDNYNRFDSLFGDISLLDNLTINNYGTYNSVEPTPEPTEPPVPWPTLEPTPEPTASPTPAPTPEPTEAPVPTAVPTSPIGDTPYNYLGNALDGINNHLEAQEYNFFGNVVEAISEPFEPLLKVLESTTSIWRYVVMWVGNISAPFNWTLSALGSAGSYFLTPFAAIAAASIVIAIYRRFLK